MRAPAHRAAIDRAGTPRRLLAVYIILYINMYDKFWQWKLSTSLPMQGFPVDPSHVDGISKERLLKLWICHDES